MTTKPTANNWLTIAKPNATAQLRLFCFPNAGAGASGFRTWSDKLAPNIEVCAIQLPGRENRMREMPYNRVEPLVQALTAVLRPYLTKPFAFFGHSMGALISFELARQLRLQNLSPIYLFVSGRHAPQLPNPEPVMYQLPDDQFIAQLRLLNGTPQAILESPEMMQLLMPLLRADFAVNEAYSYVDEQPLATPISAFGGLEDHRATAEGVKGWATQTSSAFKLRLFPGDHFFINSSQVPLLQAIGQDLSQAMSQAQARSQ